VTAGFSANAVGIGQDHHDDGDDNDDSDDKNSVGDRQSCDI